LAASMKEFLGELPASVQKAQVDLLKPDPEALTRVFVPTKPTLLLKNERVRLTAVAPGAQPVSGMALFTRVGKDPKWSQLKMQLAGRRTYTAQLGPFDSRAGFVDYYVEAEVSGKSKLSRLTAPLEAPKYTYTLTLA